MSQIAVLDYGSGNLHSVSQALVRAGADIRVTNEFTEIDSCAALVVPGVGAYAACMQGLQSLGADQFITDWVSAGRPLLGICVGQQILFSHGVEHGQLSPGLNILPGAVEKLSAVRLPHLGWNTLDVSPDSELLAGLDGKRAYFVHSYAAHEPVPGATITWTTHENDRFIAAIEYDNVSATQFHPEKSGAIGAQVLRNWLRVVGVS